MKKRGKKVAGGLLLLLFAVGTMIGVRLKNSGHYLETKGELEHSRRTGKEQDECTGETDEQDGEVDSLGEQKSLSRLRVEGRHLVDEDGNTVQLRGISTHGLAWYPEYVNEDCFTQLHEEFGVNAIRLAMYTAENGGYCNGGSQTNLKEVIDEGVRYATANQMYVIIDWHILQDQNPNLHMEDAEEFFSEMAVKYADHTNVLYEICNEPNGETTWEDIKAYAYQITGIIRHFDKDAIIIVGTPHWSQNVEDAVESPISGYENIMYAMHFYAATHKQELRNRLKNAVESGLPVFVTEFGISEASGDGGIDSVQAEEWLNLLDQKAVSYIAWNLSNKAEASALLKSSCDTTAHFNIDDLSESGKWIMGWYKNRKNSLNP